MMLPVLLTLLYSPYVDDGFVTPQQISLLLSVSPGPKGGQVLSRTFCLLDPVKRLETRLKPSFFFCSGTLV